MTRKGIQLNLAIRQFSRVGARALVLTASVSLGFVMPLGVANAELPAAEFSQDPGPQALDQIMTIMTQERAATSAMTVDQLAEMSGLGVHRPPAPDSPRGFSLFGITIGDQSGEDAASSARASAAQASSRAVSLAAERGTTFNMAVLDSRPNVSGGREWKCLTEALYFEARSESLAGQFAVGEVILNRVASKDFPNSVCGVVSQGASRRNACQFSYNCDGKAEYFTEIKAYRRAGKLAKMMLDGRALVLTDGATFYHTTGSRPSWASVFTKTAQIGRHIFYRK